MADSWPPRNTVRKVRANARAGGHNLSRFNFGGDNGIASCMNDGCTVMVEVRGVDDWRFIRLGGPTETCKAVHSGDSKEAGDGSQ